MAEREISGRINFEGQAAEEVARLNEEMDRSVATLSELETESVSTGAVAESSSLEAADGMGELAEETDNASQAMEKAEGSASGFGGAIQALGVVAATAGIVAFAKSSIASAVSLEEQAFRVEALSGDAFPALKAAIDRTIISQKGLRAEGDLSEAVNEALKLGVSADIVSASLEDTAVVASVLGEDLPRIMRAIGLAIETGTSSQLERLGLLSEETFTKLGFGADTSLASLTKTERELIVLTAVQDKANKLSGSFAEFTETSAGQLQIFNTQIGNVMEIIGGVFLPIMNAILGPLSDFALFLQENETALTIFQVAVGAVAVVIGVLLVSALVAAVPPAVAFAVSMIAAAAVPLLVVAGIVALIFILEDLFSFLTGGESIIGDFIDSFVEGFNNAIDFVVDLFNGFIDFIVDNWVILLLAPFIGLPGLIIFALSELFPGMKTFLLDLLDQFLEFGDDVLEFFASIPDKIVELFTGIGDRLSEIFSEGLSFITDLFPGSPVKKGPLTILNEAGANIIELIQGGIKEAPPLDISVETGGEIRRGGVGGVQIGRVEFNISIKAPEGRFGTKDIIVAQVKEALDELARGPLRSQLGLTG